MVRIIDSINVEYLWRFITYGTMVLCANRIDLVIAVVHSGNVFSRDNITAKLIQVKNDKTFTKKNTPLQWDGAVPHQGLFDSVTRPQPIIRIVFALAFKNYKVKYVGPSDFTSPRRRAERFTAYDI
jgi:hypothetical protein